MNILLVSANREQSPYPVTPIGLAYVARPLVDAGHDVRVADLCFSTDISEAIDEAIKGFTPDLIGLSIRNVDNLTYPKTTSYLPYLATVAEKISSLGAPVVAGGSGFSLFPEEMLRRLGLVYGITGEGEAAFSEFSARLGNGTDVCGCPNLAYIKDGVFRQNPLSVANDFGAQARLPVHLRLLHLSAPRRQPHPVPAGRGRGRRDGGDDQDSRPRLLLLCRRHLQPSGQTG
ncbi:MAG: cobalamin B12-binding domain-containing protein [Deltaproteobacteria bacterium]|nr:cobalamin B12-binding domain-containing protein [Deltaproteobacteria bacterium]